MSETPIEQLIYLFSRLPGLGPRSARRIVLHLVKHQESLMMPLAEKLQSVGRSISFCMECGNLDSQSPCAICKDQTRDNSVICVVEEVADLWAMERSHIFKGRYHVLGGTLSALDGRGPEELRIGKLLEKVSQGDIKEVILATNATVEGQTTAHYITERMKSLPITISRLAHGIPMGGELDYLDEGTLNAALKSRHVVV